MFLAANVLFPPMLLVVALSRWFPLTLVSLLVLGFAYGIYEEGLMVQSFFDPAWHDLGVLAVYGRAAGVNWVWAEHLTIYHALVSIGASVALVEILYPDRRAVCWVTSRRWWVANWAGLLGICGVWVLLAKYDPGMWRLVTVLVIVALVGVARLLPARPLPPVERRAPSPWVFWLTGFSGFLG
jgi:hypothetical protein